MPLLEMTDVSVKYGYINALSDVSIFIDKGEIVSVIGANGAGKTSLLCCISSLVLPSSGALYYEGKLIPKKPNKVVKSGIIHIPEGRKTFSGLTVQDNLLVGGYQLSKRELARELQKQYELFPILRERKNQFAGTLSGGEQQLLAIGRGLMNHPKVLLLDEPSLGLAPLVVNQVYAIIEHIQNIGVSILLVEQNAKMALGICNRAYVLENGKVCLEGTGKDLLRSEAIKKAYLGS